MIPTYPTVYDDGVGALRYKTKLRMPTGNGGYYYQVFYSEKIEQLMEDVYITILFGKFNEGLVGECGTRIHHKCSSLDSESQRLWEDPNATPSWVDLGKKYHNLWYKRLFRWIRSRIKRK